MSNEPVKKRRSRRKRWRREGEARRGIYIWPNLFTTANLFSGFFGIVSSINGDFELAAIAIFASCVFDILDGKIARLTGGTSRFGVEYDSLARPRGIRGGAGFADVPDSPQTLRAGRLAGCFPVHGMRGAAACALQCAGRNDQQEVFRRPADSGRGEP